MRYLEYKPSPLFSGLIADYWSLKIQNYSQAGLRQLQLPDFAPEWIFILSAPGESRITLKIKKGNNLIYEKPAEVFGIRFRSYGLSILGNINMRELRGASALSQPGLIFPELQKKLGEIIFSEISMAKKIDGVENIFKARLPAGSCTDAVVRCTTEAIARNKGNVRVESLCERYNISRTALNDKFLDFTGCTPKEFARIYRLNSFMRRGLQVSKKTTLAALAQSCGYYDQSHLNREFKALTTVTPTRFFANAPSVIMRSAYNFAGKK